MLCLQFPSAFKEQKDDLKKGLLIANQFFSETSPVLTWAERSTSEEEVTIQKSFSHFEKELHISS